MGRIRLNSTGLIIFVSLSIVAYVRLARLWRLFGAPLRGEQFLHTIAYYSLAFFAFVGALRWVERRGGLPRKWLWSAAILFRLIMLLAPPTLSNDVYRYLWDGHVANQGVSPYAYPIDAPELDYLEIPQRNLANHTWMASPYLPAAQLLFWGMASLFPLEPFFVQMIMLVIDLAVGWLLEKLLTLAALPRHRVLVYLWNPLVIIEVTGNAHMDVWMVLLALAAVYLTLAKPNRTSTIFAPIFLALATLTKLIPVFLLPVLFWRWDWRQRFLFGMVTLGLLIPFGLQAGWGLTGDLDGTGLFGAFRIYNDQWNFNSGLFHWLERWLDAPGFGRPLPLAKNIALLVMLISMGYLWLVARLPRPNRDVLRLLVLPAMAYLLLTPTVHPWYSLILLVFLPFLAPSADEENGRWFAIFPWLYLSWALSLSYITYLDPLNPGEREWVRQVEWLPTLMMLSLYPIWFWLKHYLKRKVLVEIQH